MYREFQTLESIKSFSGYVIFGIRAAIYLMSK